MKSQSDSHERGKIQMGVKKNLYKNEVKTMKDIVINHAIRNKTCPECAWRKYKHKHKMRAWRRKQKEKEND